MTAIKVILVVAIVLLALLAFRHRDHVGLRAGGRVLILIVFVLGLVSVAVPSITQHAADLVGVRRGTDLLLYLFVITFGFTTATLFFRLRETERRLASLTRALAIHLAVVPADMDFGDAKFSETDFAGPNLSDTNVGDVHESLN